MKSILINPENQTVVEIEYDGTFDGSNGAYRHMRCENIELAFDADLPQNNFIMLDEEGTFKKEQWGWRLKNGPCQGYVGRAMTGAQNDDGDTVESKITIEFLEQNIVWLGRVQ